MSELLWRGFMGIKNFKELEKAILDATKGALEYAGEKTSEIGKEKIDEDVYGAGTPNDYERTYDLRKSVKPDDIKSKKNGFEIEVKHDTSMIHSSKPNHHYSVVDGSSSAEYIDKIVHNGESGRFFGEGFWTKKRPYMDNAKKELEDGKHKENVKKGLKKQGLKVK